MGEERFVGETIIGDEVVASIAGLAAKEVKGVAGLGKSSVRRALTEHLGGAEDRARMGVQVEVGKTECIVDLQLSVLYGVSIPKIINEVRKQVALRLMEYVGLIAKEINVHAVGIEIPERKQAKVE
ncbi:MAG TPA: Asp23/Gls24 family envelope stress response protein [Dehalococcoidia bacterium]|nr:Asp23/Gls24 family envelope stress response protein [Dehalococcoidia bacterium]